MSQAHQKYIQSKIENCKKDNSWAIMLKWDKLDEVKNKLDERSTMVGKVGAFITKYKYQDTQISLYKNGKMMLINVKDIDNLLKELLG